MITNNNLIEHLTESFKVYAVTGSRSDKKLYPLHGGIAKDIMNQLINNNLDEDITVDTKGYGTGKEAKVKGKYYKKDVDITFIYKNKPICGINVKSIQTNYNQNSGNYYEGMLGETLSLQLGKIPLAQVFAVPYKIPYFKSNGDLKKWEYLTPNHTEKYVELSKDEGSQKPFSMLIFNYNMNEMPIEPKNSAEYKSYHKDNLTITECNERANDGWGSDFYFNNYNGFIMSVVEVIKGKINECKSENV